MQLLKVTAVGPGNTADEVKYVSCDRIVVVSAHDKEVTALTIDNGDADGPHKLLVRGAAEAVADALSSNAPPEINTVLRTEIRRLNVEATALRHDLQEIAAGCGVGCADGEEAKRRIIAIKDERDAMKRRVAALEAALGTERAEHVAAIASIGSTVKDPDAKYRKAYHEDRRDALDVALVPQAEPHKEVP